MGTLGVEATCMIICNDSLKYQYDFTYKYMF